ncbi:5-oxoprolinase subunit PxpA [Microbacterium aoyamense]|uniref:5-oxoprolinase subunit PxpA n=1 Tax=Microbacterium aoyamense TaxID=344166 RepID=A0ABN2PUI3_9MICO|nr:5-oxoprolinase subunit PxpA [Microbacterium aoyamense]
MTSIDLNADLGETVDGVPTADDEAMFAVISSANIACGAHAGDAESMREAADRAERFGVAVGAHPSFPDTANFGRVDVRMPADELTATVAQQLAALDAAGAVIRYVKPHGALYHAVSRRTEDARAVASAVAIASERLGRALPILGMDGAIVDAAAEAGLPFVREAFLDRGYLADGTLVPRSAPGALLDDPDAVAARAVLLVDDGIVETVDGERIAMDAASLCLHGDSPSAVAMARAVRSVLDDAGVTVHAPW